MNDHDYMSVLARSWGASFCDAVLRGESDDECVEIVAMMLLDMRGLSPAEIVEGCGRVDISDIAEHEEIFLRAIRDNHDQRPDVAAAAIRRLRSLVENRDMKSDPKIKPGKGGKSGKPRV
jgi:hypothetical protein